MTAATELAGVSQVFLRLPMETLFKDRYFVSGSGIAKLFKDQAQFNLQSYFPLFILFDT